MCGIAACILKAGNIGSKMYESLKRLEYRGYDSVGIASIYNNKLIIKKDAGKIDEVNMRLNLKDIHGKIGIAHCLHPDTLVMLANGEVKKIKDLPKTVELMAYDFKRNCFTKAVGKVYKHRANRLLRIRTSSTDILSTEYHNFYVFNDESGRVIEKPAYTLRIGELLIFPQKVKVNGNSKYLKSLDRTVYYKPTDEGWRLLDNLINDPNVKNRLSKGYRDHIKARDRNVSSKVFEVLGVKPDERFFKPVNSRFNYIEFPSKTTPELMRFLGYLYGDGSIGNRYIRFKDHDRNVLEEYSDIIKKIFSLDSKVIKGDGNFHVLEVNSIHLVKWLKKNFPELIIDKKIPSWIGSLRDEEVYAFIGGLYDAEGGVGFKSKTIFIGISDIDAMKIIQMLMLRAGILASISYGKIDRRDKNIPVRLQISNKYYVNNFIKTIGRFISRSKLSRITKIYGSLKGLAFEHIKVPIRKKVLRERIGNRRFLQGEGYLTLYTIQKYRDYELERYIKKYLSSPIVYQRIKSIDEIEYDGYVYDIEVDEYHNFIANATIQHNSRWATHGSPTKENAHPHTDCNDTVAVVHNGVIENFQELKQELIDLGHVFKSLTDTEVFPHLVEEELKRGLSLYEASLNAVKRIRGSYAFAVISVREPDKIICIRNESPLIIGVGEDGMYCASDIPAILPYTNKIIPLRNGEIAILTKDSYEIRRIKDDKLVDREPEVIEWSIEAAAKHGYPHFMLKEIHEQPDTLRNALRLQEKYLDLITLFLDRGKKIFIVAAGTSYHAGLAASYMFSKLGKVHVDPVIASEFIDNYGESVDIDTVVLAVSQSGETYDTLKAVDHARMRAATVIGITNTLGSTLTRVSRAYILQQAGPEIGVAATKTFTSQLTVLAQIVLRLSKLRGKVSQDEIDEFTEELWRIPDIVAEVIERSEDKVRSLARKYKDKNLFLFLGRGINTATAYEGRLKLLEIAYIPSLAFPSGESVSYDTPVMIKDRDGIKIKRIHEVVDKYFEDGEEGVKEIEGLYTLGIDSNYNVKFRRVRAVARHKTSKIYRIRYQGGEIRTTGDHSVFVFSNKGIEAKEVRNLKVGDILVTFHKSHVNTMKNNLVIDVSEYYLDEYARTILKLYKKAFELYRNNLSIPEISRALNLNERRVRGWIREGRVPWVIKNLGEPHKLEITPELMKLFGYYLAEGCVWSIKRKGRKAVEYSLSFSFNVREEDKIKFVIENMKKYFNVKPSGITHPEESETSIIYHRKRIALLFKRLFGSNAHNKRIPPFFYSLSLEHIKSFIEGYSSDGYISKNGGLSLFTVNEDLAVSILWLLKIHGINPILIKKKLRKRKINGKPIKDKGKYLYVVKLPSSENLLLRKGVNRVNNPSKSRMIPSQLLKVALKLVSRDSSITIKSSSKYRYIFSKSGLVNINNARELMSLLIKRDKGNALGDIKKVIFSDLGSAKVLDIDIEDYDGYVYDFCGAENEAFFGGYHPILLHNSKHGPIAVVEEGVPVIFIAPRDSTRKDIIGNIMEMRARGARIISLCEEGDKDIIELSDDYIEMPRGIPELLTPIPYVVPLQLFAYYMAIERGLDPDKPRNLAKSVTVP